MLPLTYFVFFDSVCGLAQRVRLELIKLLLALVYNDSLLVDPRSLCYAAKKLDVVLSVTCDANSMLSVWSHFHP